MSLLLVASNRPPNLVILEWFVKDLFVRITMAHLNLVSDFLSVQSDESSDVLFLARKGEESAILRATSSLEEVVGVVGSLQGGDNGTERPLRGALFQSLMN
jgi:hypothetical protein